MADFGSMPRQCRRSEKLKPLPGPELLGSSMSAVWGGGVLTSLKYGFSLLLIKSEDQKVYYPVSPVSAAPVP